MIIQIAGTNGSGKSTVVRNFMDQCHDVFEVEEEDRVVGYKMGLRGVERPVRVLGPYTRPTGGCDNFKSYTDFSDRLRVAAHMDHVIFEGAGHTMNQTRGPLLVKELERWTGHTFTIVLLTTPLGICINSVNERRAERGREELGNLYNVENNHTRAKNYTARMRDAGAGVVRVSRDEAVGAMVRLLRA